MRQYASVLGKSMRVWRAIAKGPSSTSSRAARIACPDGERRRSGSSRARDIWNQPTAQRFLLDRPRRCARIDDNPIDLQHPDQGILLDPGRERPVWIQLRQTQQIADLLGLGL